MDTEQYKKMFLREGRENLELLNKSLLALEKKPSSVKAATELMRAAHTLKSSSAAMGYAQLSTFCHTMEDGFDRVRAGKTQLTEETIDFLFKCLDVIERALEAVEKNTEQPDYLPFIKKLRGEEGPARLASQGEAGGAEGVRLAERPETIRVIEEIKVETKTLDNLMNLAEELLVNKMRLAQITNTKNYDDLPVAIDVLGRLVSDLQYNVTQARMVPIGQIFERFPRMVRDLAKRQKKIVELEMQGKEIELDRTILDKIGEPLVHLLRNAVDHGVVKEGKVSLIARREKSYVIIEVANTGKPFDLEAIKQAAIKREIITAREAQGLTQEQILNLIYHPRLSTSAKITETSGRGVGLNIVKTRIESLGGTVSLESAKDKGTKFILRLPLTLAIIQALLFKVKGQIYAIPLSQIVRLVRVPVKEIRRVFDVEMAVVAKQDIPLVRLDKLFSSLLFDIFGAMKEQRKPEEKDIETVVIVKKPSSAEASAFGRRSGFRPTKSAGKEERKTNGMETVIVVKKEDRPVAGLVVDELMAGQEIVIKPLTGILRQGKGFAGITILGDGRPALILDVATLIQA